MSDLFKDIVPAILQTKKDVLEDEKDYNAFVVNKALSFHYDCILQANQMNQLPSLDGKMQFHYLLGSVRPWKRPFQKWLKQEKVKDLDYVKEFYGYCNDKAEAALEILNDDQLEMIKKSLNRGGTKRTG